MSAHAGAVSADQPPLIAPSLARRMACWLYEGMLLFGVVFITGSESSVGLAQGLIWELIGQQTQSIKAGLQIVWNPAAAGIQAIGILALRITNLAGVVTVLGETEVYINAHNPDPEVAATMRPVNTDAPLMWVVDSTQLSANNRHITLVEVVGTVWDGNGGAVQIDMRTQRGMIYGFALKGVFL